MAYKYWKAILLCRQTLLKTRRHYSQVKKYTACDRALDHFDDFYGNYFGSNIWETMREGLLRKKKFMALVNNFGDTTETIELLERRGAHNVRRLFNIQKEFDTEHNIVFDVKKDSNKIPERIEEFATLLAEQDISNIYPTNSGAIPQVIESHQGTVSATRREVTKKVEQIIEKPNVNVSLADSMAAEQIDFSRIVSPSEGFNAAALYQHVPVTKLHGIDDWVPESSHFQYYSSADDFPLNIVQDDNFDFPEHLIAYSFESDNNSTFPEPTRSVTGVVNYYLLDGASLLPVIALDLKGGEKILDMCAAPGGKSLAILQTMLADTLQSNDVSISRINKMQRIFKDYLIDYETSNRWKERSLITSINALEMCEQKVYDRVLLDAPCTTDKISITELDNNIFKSSRIKERLRLPEIQAELLKTALNLVKVGGIVVYSTCTLSPIQNDGVVHMALKAAFETHGITASIMDFSRCLPRARAVYKFGFKTAQPKYGQLVIPNPGSNFGPSYFSKIVRTQ